jgi:hypothetical protein
MNIKAEGIGAHVQNGQTTNAKNCTKDEIVLSFMTICCISEEIERNRILFVILRITNLFIVRLLSSSTSPTSYFLLSHTCEITKWVALVRVHGQRRILFHFM